MFAAALLGFGCQDTSDDTGFTPQTPVVSIVESKIDAEKKSADYQITVKSNLPWRLVSDADWVTFDPANGLSDAVVKVTVATNRSLNERKCNISAYVIRGQEVSIPVIQAPSTASDLATHYYVKAAASADNDGLSWAKATTLAHAIDLAMNGDYIHVAAGSYTPTVKLNGMKSDLDATFEIHSNFHMIGGYPANATDGAVPNPLVNETILDGNQAVCHVVCVTATKMTGLKASIEGFSIQKGSSTFDSPSSIKINGVTFYQSYGAGLFIGNSCVDVINCQIKDNTDIRCGAIRVGVGAEALFDNCVITNNTTSTSSSYNCGAMWADGCQLLTINNCTFSGNKASGVAPCLYIFGESGETTNVIISNSTFTGNCINPEHTTRNGGGIYVRERGNVAIVNCTFSGNKAGKGGGIAVYGTASAPSKTTIIGSTITDNSCVSTNAGPGLQQFTAFATLNVYNTIISGNKCGDADDNVYWQASNNTKSCLIVGSDVYNAEGDVVASGAFDYVTMLGPLANNGGVTQTHILQGDNNPARTYGMATAAMTVVGGELTPAVDKAVVTVDQTGLSREGQTAIGACVK